MNKDTIEDLTQSLGKIYTEIQNSFITMSLKQLLKGIKNAQSWNVLQLSALRRLQEQLQQKGAIYQRALNNAYKNALLIAYAKSINGEVKIDKDAKEFKVAIPDRVNKVMEKVESKNAILMKVLQSQVMDMHRNAIEKINFGYTNNIKDIKNPIEISPLKRTNEVFNQIKKISETYGVENAPKVNYKTESYVSRQVTWKSYAEMNARTTLQQETGDYQLEAGASLGIVFYLCSQHSDCAKDHIDYQGKIYYDEGYSSFGFKEDILDQIEKYISSHKLKSIQSVRDNEPYLTTRPNCRHYFEPIPMMDLLEGNTTPEKKLNELSMNKGKGDFEKYEALQEQRYNERMIRKWKEKRDKQELLVENSPNELKVQEQQELDYLKNKVSEWQKRQREHLKENNYLERNYERESYKTVVEDLGYKASL